MHLSLKNDTEKMMNILQTQTSEELSKNKLKRTARNQFTVSIRALDTVLIKRYENTLLIIDFDTENIKPENYKALQFLLNDSVRSNLCLALVSPPASILSRLDRDCDSSRHIVFESISEAKKFAHKTHLFRELVLRSKVLKRAFRNLIYKIQFELTLFLAWQFFRHFCRGQVHKGSFDPSHFDQGFIIAPNHVSYLDWLILYQYFRKHHKIKIQFLAKEKLFYHPVWKGIMHIANCIMVSDDGKRIVDPLGYEVLQRSPYIGIFPEGKRSTTGELLPAKPGVIRFSKKLDLPIIPIGLSGFFDAWPAHQSCPKPSKCSVNLGEALFNEEDKDLCKLMNTIQALSKSPAMRSES